MINIAEKIRRETRLILGVFQAELHKVILSDIRLVELGIFVVALYILRKYKVSVVIVILGSGVVETLIYALLGTI